jgi:hypothetical protein
VGLKNVLNDWTFDSQGSTVGYYSTYGDPRLRTYYINLKKTF